MCCAVRIMFGLCAANVMCGKYRIDSCEVSPPKYMKDNSQQQVGAQFPHSPLFRTHSSPSTTITPPLWPQIQERVEAELEMVKAQAAEATQEAICATGMPTLFAD